MASTYETLADLSNAITSWSRCLRIRGSIDFYSYSHSLSSISLTRLSPTHIHTHTEELYGSDAQQLIEVLNNLGVAYLKQGQLPAAEEHLERALPIVEHVHGFKSVEVARLLHHLGQLYVKQERLTEAQDTLERALEVLSQWPRENRKETGA